MRGLPLLRGMTREPARVLRGSIALAQGDVDNLRESGALVEVSLSQPDEMAQSIREKGGDPGAAFRAVALIDTGASIAAIDNALAQRLGLVQTGEGSVAGVTGVQTQPIYAAKIEAGGVTLDPWRVLGSPLSSQGFQVLLGRDFLEQTTLVYDGRAGSFTLGGGGSSFLVKALGIGLGLGTVGLVTAFALGAFRKRR